MSEAAARALAQAKVNLLLHILAREASGYHQLETLFCRLELADVIVVRTGGAVRSLDCTGPMMPPGGLGPTEDNLAYRAASAFSSTCGWPSGFAIEIEKNVPVGGGLGGGSADAGTVLRILNALAPRPLPQTALLTLAAHLGADVPFLTLGVPLALAWGRGERLLQLPALPSRAVILAVPPLAIATKDAYAWLAASGTGGAPRPVLLDPADVGSWERVAERSCNAFEDVVFARFPELARARDALASASGTLLARLSGSGSALYAVRDGDATTESSRAWPTAEASAQGWKVIDSRTAAAAAPIQRLE